MRKILITVEYFGKYYAGWQCQNNVPSVQGVLEEKLSTVLKEPIKIYGSGRTDSGVHALGQKAHFMYSGEMPDYKIAMAVNTKLPDDIRVISSVEIFDENFHAQFSAKRKTYVYKCYVSRTLSPLRNGTYAQIPYDLDRIDFDRMGRAVTQVIGIHDFKGFSSTGSNIVNTVRTIYDATLKFSGDEMVFSITGNGFLYNMVRIIAGTLVGIGIGKLPEDAISHVFLTKSRKDAGKTYPAQGLILYSVEYN